MPKETLRFNDARDLPALHNAANRASLWGQKRYLKVIRGDLVALVLGAACAAISLPIENQKQMQALRVVAALLLGASLLLTLILRIKNYERTWYGGRATAESVKTSAWKYMMGAEPFELSLAPDVVDRQFASSLQQILDTGAQLAVPVSADAAAAPQITSKMREVRQLAVEERKQVYLNHRISDQREWYASKAKANARWEGYSFTAVMLCQGLAITYALYLVVRPMHSLNFTSVLATLAAAILAWMQVKQYQELAQSYAVAAHELGLIAEQAPHVRTDETFSVFVADAENAISREHTLWAARRDVLPKVPVQRGI